METLPTWEQVLTSFTEPPDGNLWDGSTLPQPKAAEQDLWDHATSFWVHPRDAKMGLSGDADESSGLTEVAIYPACATSLQRAVVLAFLALGQIDTVWQATQLTYK